MTLSPHEIESKRFVTTFRGFDATEVVAFLSELAAEVRGLLVALYAADEEVADHVLLQHGERRSTEVAALAERGREARSEAGRIVREAENRAASLQSEAARSTAQAVREAAKLLARAQAEADEIVRAAKRERDRILWDIGRDEAGGGPD